MADIFFGKFSELVTPEEKRSEITSGATPEKKNIRKKIFILASPDFYNCDIARLSQ